MPPKKRTAQPAVPTVHRFTLPRSVRAALRTFLQAFLGAVITSGILSTTQEAGVVDWSAVKKVAISALAAAVIAAITLVQNALEDNTALPAIGRNPEEDS